MAEIPIQRKERSNIWPVLLGLLVLLAVLWFLFYRRHNTDTAAGRGDSTTVASNGAVSSENGAGAATGAAGGAAAGTAGAMNNGTGASGAGTAGGSNALSDADITSVIHEVNAGEIAAGKVASTKASNSEVKSFAREMVKDHAAMDAKGSKLAKNISGSNGAASGASNTALRDSVVSANNAVSAQLQSAGSGAAFDKAYIDAQVTGHQNALTFLQNAQSSAQSSELKSMISSAIPDVQKHLDRAKALQSKVGQGSTGQ